MFPMFSPRLLDHFEHPRNAGDVAQPDGEAQIENPACGDVLRLTAKAIDDRITQIGFRAKGCVASMACASAMTELAKGCTLAEARAITPGDIVTAVGGVPPASTHAAQLAADALTALLQKLA
jgi:nitrogen fixation protein NifU and related proteins